MDKLFDEVDGNAAFKFLDDGTNDYNVRVNCQPRNKKREVKIMAQIAALEADKAKLVEALNGAYKALKIALTCNHFTADEYAFIGEWTDEIRAILEAVK